MKQIVGIGANVYDTLILSKEYPTEDTKLRAADLKVSGGGPCATGLCAAAKLGADTSYIGVLSDDASGLFLASDMKKYGVSTEDAEVKSGFVSFSSFILLNTQNASRTCVFHKGTIPPLELNEKQIESIKRADLLLIDGNEMQAAIAASKIAKENGTKILYDAGGLYDGVENLLPYADILIPSEEFAEAHTGTDNAEDAAKKLFEMYSPEVVVVTCGKIGGIIYDGKQAVNYPSFPVNTVDSNGAGDVFHGAYSFAVTHGLDYLNAAIFSSAVSALKCTKVGAREGVPTLSEVTEFLKERGYNEFKENLD